MNALIFAAGMGERMLPLTRHTPKPLLQVHGKALIVYHLEALARAGIAEVVINVSHLAVQIKTALGDGSHWGLKLHYSEEEPPALETGGGMQKALAQLGQAPFIALNGDVFVDLDFSSLTRRALDGALAHLLMVHNPEHHPEGDFVLHQGKLRTCGPEKLTFSGIGLYHPQLLSGLAPGRYKLGPILREAMAFGSVTGEHFTGLWEDVGTPERLTALNAMALRAAL